MRVLVACASVAGYDAFVVGSAVHDQSWLCRWLRTSSPRTVLA